MESLGNWYYLFPAMAGALGVLLLSWLANRPSLESVCKCGYLVKAIYGLGLMLGAWGFYTVLFDNPADGINEEAWLPYAMFIMTTIFVWAFVDALFRKIRWTESTLILTKIGWGARELSWDQIQTVYYQPLGQYWCVRTKLGKRFAFSELMTGCNKFLDECRKQGVIPNG